MPTTPTSDPDSEKRTSLGLIASLILLLVILLVNFNLFYVGFMASDDGTYILSARELISESDYVPQHHWGFRYPIIFPIALLETAIDKPSELNYTMIPLAFGLILGAVLVVFLWANFGDRAAVAGSLLFATMPLVVVQSSIINCDVTETLFLFVSIVFFYYATNVQARTRALLLLASGLFLSVAMTNRETAYGFLLVYGLLFLRGAYFARPAYLWGFAGALSLIAIEWVYFLSQGESFLYRYLTISQSHGTLHIGATGDFEAGSGNITDDRLLAPILSLLVNQEFVLVFYFAGAAALWIWFSKAATAREALMLRLFLFAAVVYFLWLSFGGAIRPLPRYFFFLAVLAVVPIAFFFAKSRHLWFATLVLLALVGSNYLALSVENIHPRFATRTLIAYAQEIGQPIAADQLTANRATRMARSMRLRPKHLVLKDLTTEGFIYFANVDGRTPKDSPLTNAWQSAIQREEATLVHHAVPPKLLIGHMLDLTGLGRLLSEDQYRWLAIRNPEVKIYRFRAPTPQGGLS